MGTPFIGEIKMFGGNFAPLGYAFCDGQLLSIAQYDALFALIGTNYGGDGITTFALPDFRGRLPVHQGNSYTLGQLAGSETVTLINTQLPSHSHGFPSNSANGNALSPNNAAVSSTTLNPYAQNASPDLPMGNQMIGGAGGNQPHDNMMPYLCINFIIALEGIFPQQS